MFAHGLVLQASLRLGKEVSQVLLRGYVDDLDRPQVLLLLGVVVLDRDVLGSFVGCFVLCQFDGCLVVLLDDHERSLDQV